MRKISRNEGNRKVLSIAEIKLAAMGLLHGMRDAPLYRQNINRQFFRYIKKSKSIKTHQTRRRERDTQLL